MTDVIIVAMAIVIVTLIGLLLATGKPKLTLEGFENVVNYARESGRDDLDAGTYYGFAFVDGIDGVDNTVREELEAEKTEQEKKTKEANEEADKVRQETEETLADLEAQIEKLKSDAEQEIAGCKYKAIQATERSARLNQLADLLPLS